MTSLHSADSPGDTRCHVVPASASYGRLMPRGAGFCHVFCGAFIVRFTALSPSSQIRRQMSGGFDLHRIVHTVVASRVERLH